MKKMISLLCFLYTFNSWAICPNLEGVFYDASENLERTITQTSCIETVWKDQTGTTVLIADKIERVLQQDKDMIAYATTYFTNTEFIVDIRMDWGKYKEWDLPARWLTSYFIDKKNNLVEKIVAFDKEGNSGSVEYITFRRIK